MKDKVRLHVSPVRRWELEQELPKLTKPMNDLRAILKSELQSDVLPEDISAAYTEFIGYLKEGFPDSATITFCADAKGKSDVYHRAKILYDEVKHVKATHEAHFAFLVLKDGEYKFADGVFELLDNIAGEFVEGETAIKLANQVAEFLTKYHELYEVMHNRITGLAGDQLPLACPLVVYGKNLQLRLDAKSIQHVADVLDAEANPQPPKQEPEGPDGYVILPSGMFQ